MIGKSGSGKTSYMTGLHDTLSTGRVNDFFMAPTANNLSSAVKNQGKFNEISFEHLDYNFPSGTQQTTVWSFDLLHARDTVCELEWIDYRGGILDEVFSSKDIGDNSEVQELLGHISLSNAVLLFTDSILLAHYNNDRTVESHTGARVINQLLRQYSIHYPNRNLNIVIVLTKADSDAIPEKFVENDYRLLIQKAKTIYSEVVSLCRTHSPRWTGGIVPVGIVGRGNTRTKKTGGQTFRDLPEVETTIVNMPEPFNVELPLFFAIGQTLDKMRYVTEANLSEYKRQTEAALKKSGKLRDIWCKIADLPNPRETAVHFSTLMQKEMRNLNSISANLQPLIHSYKSKVPKI